MALVQHQANVPAAPRSRDLRRRQTITAYLFILPGMALFLVWTLYPLLFSFVMSFAQWNLIKPSRFVGLENYTRALNDPVFWLALRNTISYTLITVPGCALANMTASRKLQFGPVPVFSQPPDARSVMVLTSTVAACAGCAGANANVAARAPPAARS